MDPSSLVCWLRQESSRRESSFMDSEITELEDNASGRIQVDLARNIDGLFDMPRRYAVRPNATGTDNSFFRPANIDIVITPCESSIKTDYEQAELRKKIIRKRRRISKSISWLCSCVNERRMRNAASSKNIIDARKLINNGSDMDLNAVDDRKRTALHISAANGADEFVRLLLENGASPNVKDINGNTPLHLAACSGFIPIVTLLLHYGGDISATDTNGRTPLHLVLSRQKMFQKSTRNEKSWSHDHLKRKAQLKDIADLLRECLMNKGSEKDKDEIALITERIPMLASNDEVSLLCDM